MLINDNSQPQENQISFNISANFYSAIFDYQETLTRSDILI